jgi:uncharacterized protein (TIGR03435 family)
MRRLALMLILAMAATVTAMQTTKPSFEVASIKPNTPGRVGYVTATGGRVVASSATLRVLLQRAYTSPGGRSLLRDQIVGGPNWLGTDTFDIDAKAEAGSSPTTEQLWLMLRTLLEDRFHLMAHSETREMPVYNLFVTKSGKLKPSADQSSPDPHVPPVNPPNGPARGSFTQIAKKPSPTSLTLAITGNSVRLDMFLNLLQQYIDRPVIDKTGLTGLFDVHIEFEMGSAGLSATPVEADPGGPNLFTAVQEDLGLKLESARGPVEVIVLDSVSKPTEN